MCWQGPERLITVSICWIENCIQERCGKHTHHHPPQLLKAASMKVHAYMGRPGAAEAAEAALGPSLVSSLARGTQPHRHIDKDILKYVRCESWTDGQSRQNGFKIPEHRPNWKSCGALFVSDACRLAGDVPPQSTASGHASTSQAKAHPLANCCGGLGSCAPRSHHVNPKSMTNFETLAEDGLLLGLAFGQSNLRKAMKAKPEDFGVKKKIPKPAPCIA